MDAIRTESLTKSFGDITAVDNLTLTVGAGELFGLVGPDGAGKTTTMRLLTGILEPTSGEAWVAGFPIVKEAGAIQEQIGYMSQRFGLYPDLTVAENLHFYADIYGVRRAERRERMERLLAFSNLEPFQKRRAGDLSGGMKQKLGLACALIHTPRVLFLDEPTSGVDPVSRREFWRLLAELLRENVTIFVSTAYLDEAERFHRLALIHNGQLLACGTPAEVKALMRGAMLEVRSSAPREAARLLRQRLASAGLSGASVGLFGNRIHIATQNPDEAAAQARTILDEGGFAVETVRRIEPTLEDVFLSVLSEPRP